jgi:hypothetical protein
MPARRARLAGEQRMLELQVRSAGAAYATVAFIVHAAQQLLCKVCSASASLSGTQRARVADAMRNNKHAVVCAACISGTALCLSPPGWELVEGAEAITECQNGWYKADWNRNPVSNALLPRMLLGYILVACHCRDDLSWHPKAIVGTPKQ